MGDVVQLSWWPDATHPTDQRGASSTSTSGMLSELNSPEIGADLDLLPPATGDHLAERLMWAMCVELHIGPRSILGLTRREVSTTDQGMKVTIDGIEVGDQLSRSVRSLLAARLDSCSGDQLFAFRSADPSPDLSSLPEVEPAPRPITVAIDELEGPAQLAIFAVGQTLSEPALPTQVAAILALVHGLELPPSRRGYDRELVLESREVLVEALNEAIPTEPTLLPTGPLGHGLATGPTDRLIRLLQRTVRAATSAADPWGEQGATRVRVGQLTDLQGLPRVWREGYRRRPVERHMLRLAAVLEAEEMPSHEDLRSLLNVVLPKGWRGYESASVDRLVADAVWSIVEYHDLRGLGTPMAPEEVQVESREPRAQTSPEARSAAVDESLEPDGAASSPGPARQLALFAGEPVSVSGR